MTKSNNNISTFLYLVMLFIFVGGCKKKEEEPPADEKTYGNIVLQFKHFVGDSALVYSSKEYINVLGQPYSVSKLKYYVSNIKLVEAKWKNRSKRLLFARTFQHISFKYLHRLGSYQNVCWCRV